MKRILNKRLETLCAFINSSDVVIDIGCDHGLLGIYLFLNKKVKVISSDVNAKPLEKARDNIIKYNLEDKIEIRLGDGLEVLSSDVNTIVISGMGCLNIIDILKDIRKYPNIKKLVLSPNNDFKKMRYEITKYGFKIAHEKIVKERGKFYLISEFIKGQETLDYYFGKLDLNDESVKEYYQYVYKNNLKIIKRLSNNSNKKFELEKENNYIRNHFLHDILNDIE